MAVRDYKLKRSSRKTLALEVTADGQVLVRAPFGVPQADIDRLVDKHEAWIMEKLAVQQERYAASPKTPEQLAQRRNKAETVLPPLVALYSQRMGLTPAGFKITNARTRFGSCSGKNSLCFSCLLMQYPDAAVEYVVVHELAHIRYKNHGAAFYALIAQYLPDYKQRIALLRCPPAAQP